MEEIFIECSPGVSGDMLLGAFYDLGVPQSIFEKPLIDMGLGNSYDLNFKESQSCSIRGVKVDVKNLDQSKKRTWSSIKKLILESKLDNFLQKKIYKVFESLAIAEGKVHGMDPENVHFHEIGAIDSLVDIVGVCAAINYLKPKKVFCNLPKLGTGFVQTEHGKLSIPTPAVIELLTDKNIKVSAGIDSEEGELSTPTGIALLNNLVTSYQIPSKFSIESYGVGVGTLKLTYPNLMRVLKINSFSSKYLKENTSPRHEEVILQEAWIDDQTPEDLANFIEILRKKGAYDVSSQEINMKKNRIGFSIQIILPIEKKEIFRRLWFKYSNTIGFREIKQSRWVLLRRRGECSTSFGPIKFKEILKPDGSVCLKPENDEILRLQTEHDLKFKEIRDIIGESIEEFRPFEDWK